MNKERKQHISGIIMLSVTALFWGAGFVLNDQLQSGSYAGAPAMLNATRFVLSAVVLLAVFAKRLEFNKRNLFFGIIGGLALFGGFQLQLVGLSYSTPAHCGFFTAAYIVFVPFISWIAYKKRPDWVVFCCIAIAIIGLFILNVQVTEHSDKNTLLGDALTLSGAILFALQIVWSDYALKKGVDYSNLTVWQVVTAGLLFVLYSLIFESKNYNAANFDFGADWWRILIVVFCGTTFAYFSQTYAQQHLMPSETSLILACESPVGAIISLIVGSDEFTWTIIVGGLLVVIAVVLVEAIPSIGERRKKRVLKAASYDEENSEKTQE